MTSTVVGNRDVTPTECISGEHFMFYGADFIEPATQVFVRLVIDPLEGPAVRLFANGSTKLAILRPSDCPVFRYVLENTNVRIGTIRVLRVSLGLDCKLADGTSIRGEAAGVCR